MDKKVSHTGHAPYLLIKTRHNRVCKRTGGDHHEVPIELEADEICLPADPLVFDEIQSIGPQDVDAIAVVGDRRVRAIEDAIRDGDVYPEGRLGLIERCHVQYVAWKGPRG